MALDQPASPYPTSPYPSVPHTVLTGFPPGPKGALSWERLALHGQKWAPSMAESRLAPKAATPSSHEVMVGS